MQSGSTEHEVKFCNNNSVLIINPNGKLKQLFTPFKVIVIDENMTKRQVYIVDEVLSTKEDKLVYIINGKPYYHHQFYIEINF